MAKPLDRDTYGKVEWHLHREQLMRDIVRDFQAEVLLSSPGTDYNRPNIRSEGAVSDPVTSRALRLWEGTDEVRNARRWVRVINRTRQWFEGTTEGRLFLLFYGKPITIALVAAALGTDRRRVEHLRDNVVYRAALYALEERLIQLKDPENETEVGT